MIADEGDLADQRHGTVVDLIDHVDAVLTEPDHLRFDACVVIAPLRIEIEDLLPVLLGQCRGKHRPRFQLHFRPKLVIGQLMIAFECNPVDQRVFHHVHDQRVAVAIKPDVLKEAGGVECLQAAIQSVRVEWVTRLHQHVREYGPGLDALIAFHLDGGDGSAAAHRCG